MKFDLGSFDLEKLESTSDVMKAAGKKMEAADENWRNVFSAEYDAGRHTDPKNAALDKAASRLAKATEEYNAACADWAQYI